MSGIDRIQSGGDITISVDGEELEDFKVTQMSFERDFTGDVTFSLEGYASDRVEHGNDAHEDGSSEWFDMYSADTTTYEPTPCEYSGSFTVEIDDVDDFDDDSEFESLVVRHADDEDDDTVEFSGLS